MLFFGIFGTVLLSNWCQELWLLTFVFIISLTTSKSLNMSRYLFFVFLCCLVGLGGLRAQCAVGQSQLIVEVVPDFWPTEISWELNDFASGVQLGSGTSSGATFCVTTGACVVLNYHDSFGDGIIAPGHIAVFIDSVQVFLINGAYTDG